MEKRELTFKRNTVISDVCAESGCDYSLPDYKPDVRKLLYTDAQVVPSSSFIDSGEICASGIVNYSVVYLDTENKMCGAQFSSDYDFSVKCTDGCEDFYVDTHLAAFSVRLVGPRKFSAKSTVISSCDILGIESIEEKGDAFPDAERELKRISVAKRQRFCAKERALAEKMAELDGVIADDVRIIYSAAKVKIQSADFSEGAIDLKGAVEVFCLSECVGSSPESYRCSLPFDERIEASGATDDSYLLADGVVSSLRVTVNPSEFGCNITADVIAELFVTATDSSEVFVTSDAYSQSGATVEEHSEIVYEGFVASASDKSTLEITKTRDELGLSDARDIVFLDAKIKTDSISVGKGELIFDGEIRFFGIAGEPMAEGEMTYVNFKHTVPYYRSVKIKEELAEDATVSCRATVSDASALFDRDAVELSLAVTLDFSYGERLRESYVSSLCFADEKTEARKRSQITVYYPTADDTLFGIAKKFRTTVKDIALSNSLSESVVSSGTLGGISAKWLMIGKSK